MLSNPGRIVTKALAGLNEAGIPLQVQHNVVVPGTLTTVEESLQLLNKAMAEANHFSLYYGLNICKYKCRYCRYHSHRVPPDRIEERMNSAIAELSLESILFRAQAHNCPRVSSLYIGGGTPALMTETQLDRLLQVCRTSFRITPETEISIEGTPDALTEAMVCALKKLGINRISMGIQRLDDDWLARVGRGHNVSDVLRALETLVASEVRFNVDLICGFDDQTIEQFLSDLTTVLSYGPHEITVYFLEGRFQLSGRSLKGVKPADPLTSYLMWEAGRQLCRKHGRQEAPMGWWLKPGVSRSQVYIDRWLDQVPLVGFGTGAYSFSRYQQYTNLTGKAYRDALAKATLPIDPSRVFGYSPDQQELHRMAFDLKSVFETQIGTEGTFFEKLEKAGLGKISSGKFQLNRAGIVVVEEIMRALIEKSAALGQP